MENVFLSTESLTKQYRGHAANNCVTVSIPRGKITGFIGKNGSGKTTLIRMLTGLAFPTSGKIEFCDADARKHIGAIVEAPAFFGGMSAKDNVVYQAKQCGVDPSNALSVLEVVGLDKNNRKKVRNYSLGMRQRLGIANALLCDPEFLILDEPTNGLDPQGMIEMRDLLHRLSREKNITILVSSHLLGELERIADYYILIDDGIIMECIGAEDLEKRLSERITVTFLGNPSDAADNAAKCVAAGGCASYDISGNKCVLYGPFNYRITAGYLGGFDVESFRTEDGNLENYFVSQVGEK